MVTNALASSHRRRAAGRLAALLALLMLGAGAARASDRLQVSDAWIPPTVAGQTVGGAYMRLRSAQDATLVGIDTDAAATVEIHQMSTENDIMRMRRIDRLELPAGQTVELAPGARHLMLVDLRRPLKAGEQVTLTLTLRLASGQSVQERVVAKVMQRPRDGTRP
jgi:copper(I)-binding protein